MSNRRRINAASQEPEDRSWTAEAERDLLLLLFAVGKVGGNGNNNGRVMAWNIVKELFTAKGYSKTKNAMQTRWTRELLDKINDFDDFVQTCIDEIEEAIHKAHHDGEAFENKVLKRAGKWIKDSDSPDTLEHDDNAKVMEQELGPSETLEPRHSSEAAAGPSGTATSIRKIRDLQQMISKQDNVRAGRSKKGKDKQRANEDVPVKLFDIPLMADISGLLPIVNTSGKICAFMTMQQEINVPDVTNLETTSLANTLSQHPHESVTVSAKLMGSDAGFMQSASVHDHAKVNSGLRSRGRHVSFLDDDRELAHHGDSKLPIDPRLEDCPADPRTLPPQPPVEPLSAPAGGFSDAFPDFDAFPENIDMSSFFKPHGPGAGWEEEILYPWEEDCGVPEG
ncbi:hypothetical protein SCAR479_04940 [Seiridium cardinale]|uniref:Myb/SANT-like domain-containing protein n=1 Tax=Seiridium cardinale TaxID=138064 RepID=A0ABR2Y599_9PEZI